MGSLGQMAQRIKELGPFGAERRKLFLSRGSKPIATAAAAIRTSFPGAANPATLLHAIEHGVKSGEAEAQRAFGLQFDAASQFIAMQGAVFENAEDGQFR